MENGGRPVSTRESTGLGGRPVSTRKPTGLASQPDAISTAITTEPTLPGYPSVSAGNPRIVDSDAFFRVPSAGRGRTGRPTGRTISAGRRRARRTLFGSHSGEPNSGCPEPQRVRSQQGLCRSSHIFGSPGRTPLSPLGSTVQDQGQSLGLIRPRRDTRVVLETDRHRPSSL